MEILQAVFRLKPIDRAPEPRNQLRRWCYRLAYSRWFDRFMLLTVDLNIVLTATTVNGAPARLTKVQDAANTVFSAVVILELLFKVMAMGLQIGRSNWHKLDVLLSMAALADIATQIVNAASHTTTVKLGAFKKVLMLARVARMFRLLRHVKVTVQSLPAAAG